MRVLGVSSLVRERAIGGESESVHNAREACQRHGRVESGSGSGSCVRALIYKRGGTNVNVEYLQVWCVVASGVMVVVSNEITE